MVATVKPITLEQLTNMPKHSNENCNWLPPDGKLRSYLYIETKLSLVKQQNLMPSLILTKQHLLACHKQKHTCKEITNVNISKNN